MLSINFLRIGKLQNSIQKVLESFHFLNRAVQIFEEVLSFNIASMPSKILSRAGQLLLAEIKENKACGQIISFCLVSELRLQGDAENQWHLEKVGSTWEKLRWCLWWKPYPFCMYSDVECRKGRTSIMELWLPFWPFPPLKSLQSTSSKKIYHPFSSGMRNTSSLHCNTYCQVKGKLFLAGKCKQHKCHQRAFTLTWWHALTSAVLEGQYRKIPYWKRQSPRVLFFKQAHTQTHRQIIF